MAKVKIKPRSLSRKKAHKKEMQRYELRRKSRKLIKKQISSLFPREQSNTPQEINLTEKQNLLSLLYKTLDSHQSKGLISKGRVNRLKSRCTKKFNTLFLFGSNPTVKTA
ncbi:30S ribosomal protein S20 [Candidatus Mycoplasma haematominutum]|uniref:Small ribosomal subunit protein bS20 n=1 Tax=Candidatus Mycoplasma haematominutum 'Birmingham 1' TaxID=1116213 RepID=G8C388_9MOLU|nr:30S ribosomal protein S20 [Candidatus Mycoplasma haematominutum]CCE66786.1 ribosomal protein S20 [Candidatus Mycoplasma haematominutum 'Birmingham 1']